MTVPIWPMTALSRALYLYPAILEMVFGQITPQLRRATQTRPSNCPTHPPTHNPHTHANMFASPALQGGADSQRVAEEPAGEARDADEDEPPEREFISHLVGLVIAVRVVDADVRGLAREVAEVHVRLPAHPLDRAAD